MSRPRLRLRRTLVVLLLLLLLALLLELNRWLPGTWPGGGGSGWEARPLPSAQRRDDRPKRDDETADPDVGVARPTESDRPLPLPGANEVQVLVLAADGTPATDARLGAGAGGAMSAQPDARGWTRLDRREVLAQGLRVRHGQRDLRHLGAGAAGTPASSGPWTVHLPPQATPPLRTPQPREVTLESTGAGPPAAGALVEALGADGDVLDTLRADAAGRVRVDRLQDVVRLRLKDGPDADSTWVSLRESGPLHWRLGDAAGRVVARVQGLPDGVEVRVRPADSEAAYEPVARGPDGALRLDPARWPAGETVELAWGTSEGLEVTLRMTVPEGEPLQVDARLARQAIGLPDGETLPASWTATARGATQDGPRGDRGGRLTVVTQGRGPLEHVAVPAHAGDVTLLVQDGVHAPRTAQVDAGQAVALPPGVEGAWLVVHAGTLHAGMHVLARSVADGRMPLAHRGRTGADGSVRLGPFPHGDVEVVAWQEGFVTRAAGAVVAAGTQQVEMAAGDPARALALRVHTPSGLPIRGARVVLSVDDGGPPLLLPPPLDELRTDANGVLEIPAYLPERPLRVQVEAAGLEPADIRRVMPGPGMHFVTLAP
ncbi:MAG: hypothetical protein AB7T63_02630 [Planctomycetota bacterium]